MWGKIRRKKRAGRGASEGRPGLKRDRSSVVFGSVIEGRLVEVGARAGSEYYDRGANAECKLLEAILKRKSGTEG